LDLGDELSREYVRLSIGNNGLPIPYSQEVLAQSLPQDWTLDPDFDGQGHCVYLDYSTEPDGQYSVHPSRFFDISGDSPTALPPGWDRRLDTWGNLFFVDHNTRSAVREDPRFNRKIDQLTGLPQGWHKITDHNDMPFFYWLIGKRILGTYDPANMTNKSVQGKFKLRSVPTAGTDPYTVATSDLPRDLAIARKEQEAAKLRPREMTDEEKHHYDAHFAAVPKADTVFISLIEALEHCKSFTIQPAVAYQILLQTDSDHDCKWDVDEYSDALHGIRVYLEKFFRDNPIQPPTPQQKAYYHAMFTNWKKSDSLRMTREEVVAGCKSTGLPEVLIEAIWERADANHDRFYNPNEFAEGMHRIVEEVNRRKGMSC